MLNKFFTTFWSTIGRASGGYYSHKIFIICFLTTSFIFFDKNANSQNLVPNWSFEDTVACPFGLTQISYSNGWEAYGQSPDYFNSCASGQAGVPDNYLGHQYPRNGSAYAGFATYFKYGINGREFLGVQLNQPLSIGQKYYLTCYVNRAIQTSLHINGGTNKLGMRLSTTFYSYINPAPIDNFAHVLADSIVDDTISWTKISGSIIADSAYEYLMIGNFFNDTATSIIWYDSLASVAYYYLDDVFVTTDSLLANLQSVETAFPQIEIYPNPAEHELTFSSAQFKMERVAIYNLLGEKIIEYPKLGGVNEYRMQVDYLPAGLYFIQVMTNRGAVTLKWVKS